jgi:hypothetical protein
MGCSHSKMVPGSIPLPPFANYPQSESAKIFVALYNYGARTSEEISFKARDRLTILDDTTVLKGSIPVQQSVSIFLFHFRKFGGMLVTIKANKDGYLTTMLHHWLRFWPNRESKLCDHSSII